MENLTHCPICKKESIQTQTHHSDSIFIQCKVCGKFQITNTAVVVIHAKEINEKLSAYIRDFTVENPDSDGVKITSDNYKEIIESIPDYSPVEKQLFLLRALKRKTEYYGQDVKIKVQSDYPMAWSKNEEEFYFHITELIDNDYIYKGKAIGGFSLLKITTDGWSYLDENEQAVTLLNQAFIAMSFNDELLDVWNKGIKPAVEKAGYKALRVDQEPHIDRIDAKIISDINDSLFIIADVTQQKQGVYFEAGYAMGLGKKVIWTVHKDDLEKVHFDTRQYAHIVWDTVEELNEQLYYLIAAVIGKR